MPIANDMKNIAEGIEVSYGERMRWLANATKDTHQMMNRIGRENKEAADAVAKLLAHFRGDHRAMAKALGTFLDESESTRIADFNEMLVAIQSRQKEREKDIHQIMSRIHGENKEAAEEVARLLSKFSKEQKELASELAQFLSLSEKQRLEDFHLMDEKIKKSVADARNETKAIMGRVRREINEIEAEIAELLSAFQKDISEARIHWQNLTKIMAAKRASLPAQAGKAVTFAKRIEEVAKEEVAEAVEAFATGGLKEQILRLISEAVSGISLAEMGRTLRIPYIVLAKPCSELVTEGKVVKKDSLYFPA